MRTRRAPAARAQVPAASRASARAEREAVLQESIGAGPSALEPVAEVRRCAAVPARDARARRCFRQLRRGQYRVDGEIDLHGLTAATAIPQLRSFLADAMQHGARVVRVIHGKGLRSGNRGPVLKLVASDYLRRVGAVLAFASAREVDGGSGAILVLLAGRTRSAPARTSNGPCTPREISTTACAARPSERPMKPSFSVVVALRFTRLGSTPSRRATFWHDGFARLRDARASRPAASGRR